MFSRKNSCYNRSNAALDDTLDKEEGKKYKTHLVKFCPVRDDFSQNSVAEGFPACVTAPRTTTHAHYERAIKLVLVFVLGSKPL